MRPRALPLASRLDGYVARLFTLSYLAAFLLVVGLFLILDMATNLDDYLAADKSGYVPPTSLVRQYYLLQLPFLYLQMSPYVTLVAGMFTAARLAKNNEIVAALGAGISVRRLLATVYLGAAFLAIGMFALREGATRELGRQRDLLFDHLTERRANPVLEDLVVRDRRGRPVRLSEYEVQEGGRESAVRGLTARFQEDELSVAITAEDASYAGAGRWELGHGLRHEDDGRSRRSIPLQVLEDPRFTPDDVELYWKARDHPLDLSYAELTTLLDREPTNAQYQTLLQYNLTFPLAGLVLLLVGLPFVVVSERGRAGERIARGFFLCMAYFGVDFVARTLGLQGEVGPLVSGWLPLVLFGSLGVVFTATMRS
jgi:lipopolysaccharide export system permease protein